MRQMQDPLVTAKIWYWDESAKLCAYEVELVGPDCKNYRSERAVRRLRRWSQRTSTPIFNPFLPGFAYDEDQRVHSCGRCGPCRRMGACIHP